MNKVWHIAAKDILVWLRDIAALGVLLAMPIVLILILGSAFGGGGQSRMPVAVVNLDAGQPGGGPGAQNSEQQGQPHNLGRDLESLMRDNERIGDAFDVSYDLGEDEARGKVAEGELVGALIIPATFTQSVLSGEPVTLSVLKDPGAQLSSEIWEGVVNSFAAEYSKASIAVQTSVAAAQTSRPDLLSPTAEGALQQRTVASLEDAQPAVEIDVSDASVVQIDPLDYYAVSMSAMFLMFGAMFGAFSTIKERREQTLSRLLSTPTSSAQVVSGKMLGIFALGMLQFTVLYLVTRFGFRVDWGADTVAVFAIAAAEMLAVTGFAVLVASIARSERGAGGIAPLVIQVQALLGGAFFSITILPAWLQPVRYVSVIGWAIEAWQTVQLEGGGLSDVLVPIGAMLGFAAVLFGAGTLLTRVRS